MANHPHDSSRPESAAVRRALENEDIEALKKALSIRQRHFAEEYIVDFNGTAAAIRAGYAPEWADRQAHILKKHAGVSAYIDYLSHSKEAKIVAVNPDYVIQGIVKILQKESAKDSDLLRAYELLGRHLKMFTDKQEISGPDGGAIEIERKTREEADEFVNNLKRSVKPDLKLVKKEA